MHKKRVSNFSPAGHASQLGRALGAVPGPVTSAASAGCHKLIRDYDAVLITSAREACELAGGGVAGADSTGAGGADLGALDRDGAWERRVLDALPLRGARELSDITQRSGLAPDQVRGVLAELELLGRVRRHEQPGGAPPKWGLQRSKR